MRHFLQRLKLIAVTIASLLLFVLTVQVMAVLAFDALELEQTGKCTDCLLLPYLTFN